GIAALEAMASGCIPIVQNLPSFKRFVKRSELLVDYADTKTAAKRIIEILKLNEKKKEELRKIMVERAKQYDWSRTVAKITKLYGELIERKN
ncbi:MAG: glycosyltransferase, partial [Candidatus Diapherotrites archaeon]|nr:glycosyltransferase [Candidatus Diapherotrites archaeon]